MLHIIGVKDDKKLKKNIYNYSKAIFLGSKGKLEKPKRHCLLRLYKSSLMKV